MSPDGIRCESEQLVVLLLIGSGEETPEGGLITKIIRMQHVHATDLEKALQTRLGTKQKGRLVAVDATDHLIITDTAAAVRTLCGSVDACQLPQALHSRLAFSSA